MITFKIYQLPLTRAYRSLSHIAHSLSVDRTYPPIRPPPPPAISVSPAPPIKQFLVTDKLAKDEHKLLSAEFEKFKAHFPIKIEEVRSLHVGVPQQGVMGGGDMTPPPPL